MEPIDLNQDHRGLRGQPMQAGLRQRPAVHKMLQGNWLRMQGGLLCQRGRQVKWPGVAFVQMLRRAVMILPSFPGTISNLIMELGP